jgi:hypothetical protein
MPAKDSNLGHSLRPVTPANSASARSNPDTQTPTTHHTRSKDSTIHQTIDSLRQSKNNTAINLDTIQGKNREDYSDIRTTCTKLGERYDELQTHYRTLQRDVTENNDNDVVLGAEEQRHNKLSDIESLALTTNMANSVMNSIQIFDGYDSHDPKLWFMKLEAYFRAKKMHPDTWLAAINGFLSDTVLYAIEDIPDDDKDTYPKLKKKIIA